MGPHKGIDGSQYCLEEVGYVTGVGKCHFNVAEVFSVEEDGGYNPGTPGKYL